MSWQKPARIGVAVIGIFSAAAVYLSMGERRAAPAPQPITRSDAKAVVEFNGSVIDRFIGSRKDIEVESDRTGIYADGSMGLVGHVKIIVHKSDTRTIQISASEAKVGKDNNYIELTGPVKMLDSDGFWLETDRATVNRADSITNIPGPATFGKGRMTGSGIGISHDETGQILLISKNAQIKTVDEGGKPVMEMRSGTAMLDRLQHFTALDTNVHVVRNAQTIDTDAANGRLSANNDVVTYVELHGNSRVTGGTSIESMSARDISLDYTEDGKTLEAVKMAGGSNVAMTGDGGKKKIAGEIVELTLAADGMLTSAIARENVTLDLPPVADAPQRNITAQTLDGTGEPGKGLTSVTFTRDVTFVENPLPSKTGPADNKAERTAHSQKLEASMASDAVTAATFTGDVTFEETGLKGCAARVEYQPGKESLALSGATKAGNPIVAEEDKAIEAEFINVSLATRRMQARGNVGSHIRTRAIQRCRPAKERAATDRGANNVPRLLKSDAPMTIKGAASLDFDSSRGYAEYSAAPGSRVTLEQEDTVIAGGTVVIDQTKGNLTATGNATSRLMLDNKVNRGSGHEIRYVDERRQITFASAPKATAGEVSLSGTDSTIRAGNIDLELSAKENTLERMNAQRNVRLTEDQHTVQGASTLVYTAADEKYVVTSEGATPVVVVTLRPKCRQDSGESIEFVKGSDQVKVTTDRRSGSSAPSSSACTPSPRK